MKTNATLARLRNFLKDYSFLPDEIAYPLSYWIAATYLFEQFDSFPYLVITSNVKRSGKTRLSELIGFTSHAPMNVAGCTAPALFRAVKDMQPTIIWDEAEQLNSEAASLVRTFLNVGYRKGQTIPRASKDGIEEWPTYCPKVFVLIGDVYDTLADRSIIVKMVRGEARKRFAYETAKFEALEIAQDLKELTAKHKADIDLLYRNVDCSFLTDRDEEIWRSLFAIASVLEPDAAQAMRRSAVDMATEKLNPNKVRICAESQEQAEKQTQDEEYARRLLADILQITKGKKYIESAKLMDALYAIDVAPWRKYFSFTDSPLQECGRLLSLVNLHSRTINGGGNLRFKGYMRKDVEKSHKGEK